VAPALWVDLVSDVAAELPSRSESTVASAEVDDFGNLRTTITDTCPDTAHDILWGVVLAAAEVEIYSLIRAPIAGELFEAGGHGSLAFGLESVESFSRGKQRIEGRWRER
jgi:hypothetical protein